MQTIHRWLAWLLVTAALRAESPPSPSTLHARRAAALLEPRAWRRVILIQNSSPDRRYPAEFSALVFEFGDVLWFYTSIDGTQSLSHFLHHAAEDGKDFGPLLRGIHLGLRRWTLDAQNGQATDDGPAPPNACFLESLALLRSRMAAGESISDPQLLTYYVAVPGGVHGHTVLFFQSCQGPVILDPHFPGRRFPIRTRKLLDPQRVACCLRGDVASARWLPVDPASISAACP